MMTTILARAAFAAALLAAPVSVQAQIETRSTTVSRAHLDLSRDRDVRTLDRRVARAAHLVCGETSDWDLAGKNAIHRCRAKTIAAFAARRGALVASARTETLASSR